MLFDLNIFLPSCKRATLLKAHAAIHDLHQVGSREHQLGDCATKFIKPSYEQSGQGVGNARDALVTRISLEAA